jgi:hypothetical protein
VHLVGFTIEMQGDQKVSVHLFLYCSHQVDRDFLITLYITMHGPTNVKFAAVNLTIYVT